MRKKISIHGAAAEAEAQALPDLQALRRAGDRMADYPTEMGLDGLERPPGVDGAALEVEIDTDAERTGQLYVTVLGDRPEWLTPEVKAVLDRLVVLFAKLRKVVKIADAAERLDRDLADTDRELGRREQDCQGDFFEVLRGLIGGALGGWTKKERDRLAVDAGQALEADEKDRQKAREAAQQTREQAAAQKVQLAEIDTATAEAEELLELAHERPLDDATLDRMVRTFSALAPPAQG